MSHPELNQLTKAEQLFDEGELYEALEIFNDQNQFEGINAQQKDYYLFLRGLILIYQLNSEDTIKLGEQLFKEGQKHNDNLQAIDGLFFIICGLNIANKFDETLKFIQKAEDLLKKNSDIPNNICIIREVRVKLIKTWSNMYIGNIELAEMCLEWIFEIQKDLGLTFEIVWAHTLQGQIMLFAKRKTNLALKSFEKALFLTKEVKFNHFWIAMCHEFIAIIYQAIGELESSLIHHLKALTLVKGFKSNFWDGRLLNNIGNAYLEKGEYDLAMEYLEKYLIINEIQSVGVEGCLDSLIYAALEKGDTERAQKYFNRLENIFIQTKDSQVEFLFKYNKALMLKRSSRIRDRAKAEKLLKQVIKTKIFDFVYTSNACIQLCDLLLSEFRINNNSEVLDEINQIITQLLTIAENSNSYRFFCEIFILQAKLALLNFDLKAARLFLTQAQKIAESYGIKRLAMKISYEHDELIKKQNTWEKLKESNASFSERWKLAGLNEQMENMLRKRGIEVPKLSDEDPVFLLILTEGGRPFFSHSFLEDKTFESHLFGGFLTTIDYFIREMFSEGLDRAIFGEHTLLMNSVPPFFISYIFKGDSYYALQKISYFKDQIQKDDIIWQNLLKSFQVNQTIKIKDFPQLKSLITDIFISKSIVMSDI